MAAAHVGRPGIIVLLFKRGADPDLRVTSQSCQNSLHMLKWTQNQLIEQRRIYCGSNCSAAAGAIGEEDFFV